MPAANNGQRDTKNCKEEEKKKGDEPVDKKFSKINAENEDHFN